MQLTDHILYYLGTGKSETGACLAYIFAITNRKLVSEDGCKCVLYCGPSNKSVDVVLGELHHFLPMSAGAMICNSIIFIHDCTSSAAKYTFLILTG